MGTLATGLYKRKHKDATGNVVEGETIWIQWHCRGLCGDAVCTGVHRESTGTSNEREAKKLRAERLHGVNVGKVVTRNVDRTTFNDLAKGIEDEYIANGRRSIKRMLASVAHLRETFGTSLAATITTERVREYTKERQKTAKPATVRLELCALKRMFELARRAEQVGRVPFIEMVEVHNTREVFFEEPQYLAVRALLADDLKPVVDFMWLCGWRTNEVLTLKWSDINFAQQTITLSAKVSKNKRSRPIPFSLYTPLRDLIYAQRERTPKAAEYVFTRDGRQIKSFAQAWRTATKRAGLAGYKPHDFRRSAAMRVIAAGLGEQTGMLLLGHLTPSIFRRYNIVPVDVLAQATAKLNALVGGTDTTKVQNIRIAEAIAS